MILGEIEVNEFAYNCLILEAKFKEDSSINKGSRSMVGLFGYWVQGIQEWIK